MTDFVSTWNEESFLTTPVAPLGLIAMRGTEDMGDKVNKWLLKWRKYTEETLPGDMSTTPGMGREDFLVRATCPRFGNGEGKGLIKDSVRGLDLYILCDVGAYNCTYNMYGHEVPMSPDDHYMDLKRTIAAVGGKAKRITVIMPLLYGGRQHRRSARESLDCALMLQELNRMGVNNIITFDAHDPRVVNAIPEGGFESVMPSYQIFKALLKRRKDLKLDKDHLMIVSPDEGALDRNIFYASVLGVDMGMFYKRRDYTRIVNGRNPIVAHEYMGKEVNGKDVFVADDILSSGESMMNRLRSGMSLEITNKCLVFYKIILQHLSQILVLYFLNISKQFLIHAICTLLRCRHIIGGDIFTLLCFTDLLNVKLQIVIIADDFTIYFNKIHLIIICDSLGVRIPYFSI